MSVWEFIPILVVFGILLVAGLTVIIFAVLHAFTRSGILEAGISVESKKISGHVTSKIEQIENKTEAINNAQK